MRRHQAVFWRRCQGGKCWKVSPLDSAILSFCFLFLFSLVRLNGKQRVYSSFPKFGFEVFEEKIKKPMELYLHNNHASSYVISMISLNAIVANAMENCKLGDAGFDDYDFFSPPSFEEEICFDDTMPPINDDYNDECDLFSPPTI